jgi:creatinine amidohydrolase
MALAAAIFIARMTTEELDEILKGARPVVVLLPVGAIEPHGPHLPLDTDLIISRVAAAHAAALLEARGVHGLVAPDVAYGVTDCARDFAGAAGVDAVSFSAYLRGVVAGWLGTGASHVSVVNNHLEPAHDAAVRAAAAAFPPARVSVASPLSRRWGRTLSDEFKRGACHAGEYETSIVLAANPEAVREAIRVSLPDVEVSLSDRLAAGIDTFRAMGLDRAYAGAPARAHAAHGVEMIERLGEMVATEVLEAIGAGR